MTKQEFLDNFYIRFDAINSVGSPGFSPLEISQIATIAQEQLVQKTYNPKSNRDLDGFEESEKRIQDLGELVKNKIYTVFTASTFYNNGYEITLPNTLIDNGPTDFSDVYWYTAFEEAELDELDCSLVGNTTIYLRPEVVEVSHAEYKKTIKNPFRRPTNDRVLRLRIEGRKHILVTNGTALRRYFVAYICKPQPIDLTVTLTDNVSVLSDNKQRELLEETVQLALKNTQSEIQLRQLQIEKQDIKE